MRAWLLPTAVATLAIAVAGCGGGDDDTDAATNPGTTATAAKSSESEPARGEADSSRKRRKKTVKVTSTRYGRILVDGRRRALYLFTRDGGHGPSRCHGDCAAAWPPYFTTSGARAGSGAKSGLVGTIKRGRKRQVTYNGHPLYYYVGDREPGQVLCQAVDEFGGIWYVVAPRGDAIT